MIKISAKEVHLDGVTGKAYWDGTHRIRDPKDTLDRYLGLAERIGITRLANVTGLDRIGLPVVQAVRPNSRSLSVAQGKGRTVAAAKASALMESIETWHAERATGPIVYDSWSSLSRRQAAADLAQLPRRRGASVDPHRPLPWVEAWDLGRSEPVLVPYSLIHLNLVFRSGEPSPLLESSNGLASGNHKLEAICHALCELIERDARTLWACRADAARVERQLDLSTITAPNLQSVLFSIKQAGLAVAVWDITTDVGVPTFWALIAEDPDSPQWRPIPVCEGSGTHLDAEVALSRAILEAVQSRASFIAGARDDLGHAKYTQLIDKAASRRLVATLTSPRASFAFSSAQLASAVSFESDVLLLRSLLANQGMSSIICADLSCPEIGIPVVKAVVPGLEGHPDHGSQPGTRLQAAVRGQR